jgi:hypothetical protein
VVSAVQVSPLRTLAASGRIQPRTAPITTTT